MGVAAVPGSGKTWTLSRLAAGLIASGQIEEDQELLVVTMVNSAVDNISNRIGAFLEEEGHFRLGYRVSTLHSLAHDIVRSCPSIVGLSDDFHVIDARAGEALLAEATSGWLGNHREVIDLYLEDDITSSRRNWLYRTHKKIPLRIERSVANAIKHAKSRGLTPDDLERRVRERDVRLPLAEMVASVFREYQQGLGYRGAVDFDDLIRLAHRALTLDEDLRGRLRARWPYILEDEAQDSSQQQEDILDLIAGEDGNWVRVGDPNQAIYESFTTARPELLRAFIERADHARELPDSGRCQPSIMWLANRLIDWSREEHPVAAVRTALAPPYIVETPEGDPQPNPPDAPDRVAFADGGWTEDEEIQKVLDVLESWLSEHPEETTAILAPSNPHAGKVVAALRARSMPYCDELLRLSFETRSTAGALADVLRYFLRPESAEALAEVYAAWRHEELEGPEDERDRFVRLQSRIARISRVEDYLWPRPGTDALEAKDAALSEDVRSELRAFREVVRRWLALAPLPIDQVIVALAGELFEEPGRIALAHRLAAMLRRASSYHPEWRHPQLIDELRVIERDERFKGLGGDFASFDPKDHAGEVVVATMHGAKGLEWDRVHLIGVNDYNFPAATEDDRLVPQQRFFRGRMNIEAETRRQLDALVYGAEYVEGDATKAALEEYARERLRLLYVGITRACKELIITTNIGRFEDNGPAVAFTALRTIYEEHVHGVVAQ